MNGGDGIKVTLRPTIPADLPHVIGEPLPYRIRAITALVNDRVIGMGGIAFPSHGPAIAFVQLVPSPRHDAAACDGERAATSVPEARRYPVAFHRAGLMAMEMIRTSGVTQVIATADAASEAAVRWLKRLGFRQADDQRIAGKLLFVWTRESASDAIASTGVRHIPPARLGTAGVSPAGPPSLPACRGGQSIASAILQGLKVLQHS
jgi:hypothetical protein